MHGAVRRAPLVSCSIERHCGQKEWVQSCCRARLGSTHIRHNTPCLDGSPARLSPTPAVQHSHESSTSHQRPKHTPKEAHTKCTNNRAIAKKV